MKRILFTGATGFIGKNILPILKETYEIYAPTRNELDLRDSGMVARYVKKGKFDVIIQAANPNPTKNVLCDKNEMMFEDSLRIFMNFYNLRNECGKLFYFGSGAEFNKSRDISMVREEQVTEYIPKDAYGFAKFCMNELARRSDNVYNLRVFGCYGPYDHESKFLTHVIRCCLNDRDITINQNCYFDYIQVLDLAKVIRCMIENRLEYHDYNVCSANPISLREIAERINHQMGKKMNINILHDGLNKEYTADNTRLVNEFGNMFTFTSLDEGIRIQIEHEKRMMEL